MIRGVFFSATGTTKRVIEALCESCSKIRNNEEIQFYDFTQLRSRVMLSDFFLRINEEVKASDLLFVGVPVYAGRVPNVLLKALNAVKDLSKSKKAYVVPIVLYGNRHYDSALNELGLIFHEKGFSLLGAAAFIGEHSFSNELAKGRPNEADFEVVKQFSKELNQVQQSVLYEGKAHPKEIDRTSFNWILLEQIGGADMRASLKPYYKPRSSKGDTFDFKSIKPITTEWCISCGICYKVCPMGSIEKGNTAIISGICIKCCACIKHCPVQAKVFTDELFLFHKRELEATLVIPKKASYFLTYERREKD